MDFTVEATNVLNRLKQDHPDVAFEMEKHSSSVREKLMRFSFKKGEIEDNILFDFGFEMSEEARYFNVKEAVERNIEILEREPPEAGW